MAISKEIYREFEDIVGAENITNDPVMMQSYFGIDHAAVVLPKNTEEVQAIVRLCNKHKTAFRLRLDRLDGDVPARHHLS